LFSSENQNKSNDDTNKWSLLWQRKKSNDPIIGICGVGHFLVIARQSGHVICSSMLYVIVEFEFIIPLFWKMRLQNSAIWNFQLGQITIVEIKIVECESLMKIRKLLFLFLFFISFESLNFSMMFSKPPLWEMSHYWQFIASGENMVLAGI